MILTNLTLTDFGVFQGHQSIPLAPRPSRPVVLFGGKNGAGKSTLLEAIRVCLYGQGAFGELQSKEAYLTCLGSRIHSNPNLLIQPTFASVSLEFQYAESGTVQTYVVTRSWERRGEHKLIEQLEVKRNGQSLDKIASEHWQDFVRGLIPAGVSQLFFFDGEKIQHLAEDTSDQQALGDSIKSLLGIDIVERLQTDLGIYLSRLTKPLHATQRSSEIEEMEKELGRLREVLEEHRATRAQQESKVIELRASIQKAESKITAEGCSFVKNRERLIHSQATLKANLRQHEDVLKELSSELLPFALIPKLCLELRDQLLLEERAEHLDAGFSLLKSAKEEIVQRIDAQEFWHAVPDIAKTATRELRDRITAAIKDPLPIEQRGHLDILHQLSPIERQLVLSWITQATAEIPKAVKASALELERLFRELQKVEGSLRKIPADDVLKPLVEDLHRLHQELTEVGMQTMAKDEEIRLSEIRFGELQRRYEQTIETLMDQVSHTSKVQMGIRAQNVLREYVSVILNKKVVELQNAVSECFNTLCRKKNSLRKITIDSKDFSVTLYDKQNRPLPKSQLSAGEKQIYAIAMLWALAKTSGRPLPIIIDTPLARLDSDHRKLLVKQYFPTASHQVIILSTDTEIDQSYFNELRRSVARAYCLEYDSAEYGTKVSKGYWWNGTADAH